MARILEKDGKKFHSVSEVVKSVSYSRDYITRLAREKKIVAENYKRQWFIDVDSLQQYIGTMKFEQDVRRKQMSQDRKMEHEVREAAREKISLRRDQAKTLHTRAMAAAAMVLTLGVIGGSLAYNLVSFSDDTKSQIVTAQPAQVSVPVKPEPVEPVPMARVSTSTNKLDIATTTLVSEFTQVIQPMGDVTNGILLLPEGAGTTSTTSVPELFSDRVVVRKMPDGTEVVVRVNEFGRPVGNPIPFVSVPVEHEDN